MLKKLGIKGRVLLLTLLPTSLMALVLGGYFTWMQQSDLHAQLLQRGEMIAEQLAPLVAPAMSRQDSDLLERIATQSLEQTDVRAVTFLAPDRTPLAHAGPTMLNRAPEGNSTQLLQRTGNDATRYLLPVFGKHRNLAGELIPEEADRLLGWVELELSHSSMLLRGYRSLFASLLLITAGLGLTALLALRMGRTINRPLSQIKLAVAQLKDGHLETRLPPLGSQELDELASGINRMASTLQNAQEELQHSIDQATEDVRQNLETIEIQNIELDLARKEALEASRIKSEFLANMSHEIRTPLNGILGFTHLLQKSELTPRQLDYLGTIEKSADSLLGIINEILDFSKIEAGKLVLDSIPFNLRDLLQDTLTILAPAAHAKQLELVSLVYRDTPLSLVGDPLRLKQILTNLVSNAIKFTREGTIVARAMLEDEHEDSVQLRISIQDTGIGLSNQDVRALFQAFSQADNSLSRQPGGTGLGLALTNNLCEAMQGRLTISSEAGFGSQFYADLPLPCHTPATPVDPLRGNIVAITANSSGLAELLGMLLPAWGLDYLRRSVDDNLLGLKPDVLITDCPECLFNLRPTFNAPILLVTAYGSFMPSEQAAALAPLLQQARPLARHALYQILRRALQSETITIDDTQIEALPPSRRARVLLVEDNPVNQLVAKGMLVKLGCEVIVAAHGAEALEQLEQHTFDLVLMDCNMPVMDGYEASRQIRRSGRWPDLPIVALTANAMPEERERCRGAGMTDYLSKPFRREELAAMLDQWVPTTSAL